MKFAKVKAGLLASALTISSLGLGAAHAQTPTNAYTTKFTTSITYQNVGTGAATINLDFYAENGSTTAAAISLPQLPANGATSLFVGSVSSLASGFTGSGVLSSDQPLVATLVQLPESTSPSKNRPLSNGFSSGSGNVLIATVLKNQFGSTSKFSIQNTDSGAVDLTVSFFRAGETSAAHTITTNNLPANAAKYYDAGTIAELGASFNGSATVAVRKAGTTTAGSAVGSVLELGVSGANANLSLAFEGVASGATKVYMASALCNFFGGQNSAYAVQNTGTGSATVTVTYNSTTDTGVTRTQTVTVPAGGKASLLGCGAGGPGTPSWAAFSGSATIESNQPIIAIGKISGAGLTTGFVGSAAGAARTSLPYVRWSTTRFNTNQRDRQRTFLTIQNVGTAAVTGASVKYYDKAGTVVGTHNLASIPAGGKVNSDPSQIGVPGAEFGYYADGTSGGSAVVEAASGSQLIVVGRVVSAPATGQVGEDYSGIPLQ